MYAFAISCGFIRSVPNIYFKESEISFDIYVRGHQNTPDIMPTSRENLIFWENMSQKRESLAFRRGKCIFLFIKYAIDSGRFAASLSEILNLLSPGYYIWMEQS